MNIHLMRTNTKLTLMSEQNKHIFERYPNICACLAQFTQRWIHSFFILKQTTMLSTVCAPGYFGPNCTFPCPNNAYGDNCGGICEPVCFPRDCHHVYGCPQNTGVLVQPTKSGISIFTVLRIVYWLIDFKVFYAVSAIFQPYNGGGSFKVFLWHVYQ